MYPCPLVGVVFGEKEEEPVAFQMTSGVEGGDDRERHWKGIYKTIYLVPVLQFEQDHRQTGYFLYFLVASSTYRPQHVVVGRGNDATKIMQTLRLTSQD